ncbi:MAG: hypothetical protein IT439_05435 [Phycisphaerales bacterium]|nr:hypothetical protein [Phycisphaerales bacterium]
MVARGVGSPGAGLRGRRRGGTEKRGGGAPGDVVGGGEAESFERGDGGGACVKGHEFEAQAGEVAEGFEVRGECGVREPAGESLKGEVVVARDLREFETVEEVAEKHLGVVRLRREARGAHAGVSHAAGAVQGARGA